MDDAPPTRPGRTPPPPADAAAAREEERQRRADAVISAASRPAARRGPAVPCRRRARRRPVRARVCLRPGGPVRLRPVPPAAPAVPAGEIDSFDLPRLPYAGPPPARARSRGRMSAPCPPAGPSCAAGRRPWRGGRVGLIRPAVPGGATTWTGWSPRSASCTTPWLNSARPAPDGDAAQADPASVGTRARRASLPRPVGTTEITIGGQRVALIIPAGKTQGAVTPALVLELATTVTGGAPAPSSPGTGRRFRLSKPHHRGGGAVPWSRPGRPGRLPPASAGRRELRGVRRRHHGKA
jgi:hypothetical protein